MLQHVLDYQLDVVAFALVIAGLAAAAHAWLRSRHRTGLGVRTWLLLAAIVAVGGVAARFAGSHERDRLRDMLQGIAPTYARELELMGHAALPLGAPADDPGYLGMIAAQVRWLGANHNVSDIYTFRRLPDGQVVLVVDSETDYDRDGRSDGDRESRTAIGEEYDEVTPNLLAAFDGVASFDATPYGDRWGTWVSAYVPMSDAAGRVEAVLGVDYDASVWLAHITWNRLAALGFVGVAAAVAVGAAALVAVTRAELARRAAAEAVRERLQRELVEASRHAGMAEVATGVLHNVGNVLNSVNVSAQVLSDGLNRSKAPAVAKVAELIQAKRDDLGTFFTADQKGKVLPDYLAQLGQLLAGEQAAMMNEVAQLARSVEHIKQIVASQQGFARTAGVTETFSLSALLDDAVRMNEATLERHGVRVVREYGRCGDVTADRHKVLQILVNLIFNAKDATCAGCADPEGDRTVTLRLTEGVDENRAAVARVSVTDNGVGIKPEDMGKLFRHGFTTRTDGHGFGLHFSANAAKQMKGSLTAHSDGFNRGATFTLDLPLAQTETIAQ